MKSTSTTRITIAALLLLIGSACETGLASQQDDRLIPRAVKLWQQRPDADTALGLAEIHRAAGQQRQSLEVLARAGNDAVSNQRAAGLHERACWRMLPAEGARLAEFRRTVADLGAADPRNRWLSVYRLYLASLKRDRKALLKAAAQVEAPEHFPSAAAEGKHLALLVELGLTRNNAAVEVIRARCYRPLYALRDLDRRLTREAEFLDSAGREADAQLLRTSRDDLRTAYIEVSRHLIPRLFALKLLGRDEQRTTLMARAARVAWLRDRRELQRVLATLSEQEAWRSVIEPLLKSEVAVIETPPLPDRPTADGRAELTVRARLKRQEDEAAVYEGLVGITLGPIRISCKRLLMTTAGTKGKTVLRGTGAVLIYGLPGFDAGITADRFVFHNDTASFTLEGDVRLKRPSAVEKFRRCTVTLAGKISSGHTLLDDFAEAPDIPKKLALLPHINKVYAEGELPPPVRYLLAMKLLKGHLSWQIAYPPPRRPSRKDARIEEVQVARQEDDLVEPDDWRWMPAHGGEPWMLDDRPPQRQSFWRIKDRKAPDVLRAVKLLQGINAGKHLSRARRWLAEIERNNTVLTVDVAGAYRPQKKAPVVIDVRNAERLSLKLYRVRRGEDLLAVTRRIGEHFVYHDYGLQYGERVERLRLAEVMVQPRRRALLQYAREAYRPPRLLPEDLLHRWEVEVGRLKPLDLGRRERPWRHQWDEWDEDYDEEAEFFGDRCRRYRWRLEKSYWPGWKRHSSWQCDRLLEVPGKALKEPGAYILVAEGNGQVIYAPLVVNPLAMILRRCRDGVFVMLSDSGGKRPVAGASILADGMLGQAGTNADGVAFAKVFAAGDRAIVAEQDGRFAVGGFGDVFEGIYRSRLDELWERDRVKVQRMAREQRAVQMESLAHAYADRYVVAAYTDRPTYRPGQEVNFKLIVRHLPPAETPAEQGNLKEFREGDFQWADNLQLPEEGSRVRFTVLNPAGRAVGSGAAALNDFGTAAGKVTLSSEAKVGSYTLRVSAGGMDRVVPEVFCVRYYRRPNFELRITGLPETISARQILKLKLTGRYYFGKPVALAKADVRLVRPRAWKPLARAEVPLDPSGSAQLELQLPSNLNPGGYRLIGSLTDQSGRTVTQVLACKVESPEGAEAAGGLAVLPRFVAVDTPLEVKTAADEVVAEQTAGEKTLRASFQVVDGVARLKLPSPGWYVVTAGSQRTEVFAYGGRKPPWELPGLPNAALPADAADESTRLPRWINLTDYEYEEDGYGRDGWSPYEAPDLYALLGRQHVEVGEKLPVLVYVPATEARLLFTIEGRTVVDYLATLAGKAEDGGGYHVVEIPVKRRYLPNFYLQGRIVSLLGAVFARTDVLQEQQAQLAEKLEDDDGSEDPRWCRIDVIDPDQGPGEQRLNVTVETAVENYRPGEKVDVRIRAAELSGRPADAEVSLAAVDQSIYSFGEDRVELLPYVFSDPHPQRRYRRKTWRLGRGGVQFEETIARAQELAQAMGAAEQMAKQMAQTQDVLKQSLEQVAGLPRPADLAARPAVLEGQLPASSVPLGRLRTDFRETAAWQPQLRTGPDGVVETSFTLPDSLTRYRLTGVGLTRGADIGIGRTRIKVSMPLSVQLFLPRFAVERDRLEAVGLVHNNGDAQRTCRVVWEVAGAAVEQARQGAGHWQVDSQGGKTTVRGRLTVAAGESARVGLFLRIDRLEDVRVALRAADGERADAEQRSLRVQPLGRPREVALSGTFIGRQELKLPAGFVARDLRISVARTEVAGGLDGLAYLIEYPYGCVEQTMSRFLPAVMAKRAVQQAPIGLPPEAAEKLPDVLAKGLVRLYNFQHPDGGWGWWEKDKTNDAMTVYVVYGLARCRNTETEVDGEVLARGCGYLRQRMAEGKLDASQRPAAWLALTLAGSTNTAGLLAEAQRMLDRQDSPDLSAAAAQIALACRGAGLTEAGERLWASLRRWQPESTDQLAIKLSVQIAYGAPLRECRRTAAELMARRSGHRWESTRATSWAVEALSQMLRYDAAPPKSGRVTITVGGKTVLDCGPEELSKQPVCRVHLDRHRLPADDALAVVIDARSEQPADYAVSATGIQRLDQITPQGDEIQIRRTLRTLDGQPQGGRLRVGEVVAVHLAIKLDRPQSYLILEDRRPAGCEFADERLDDRSAGGAANVEFRDDRVAAFFTSLPAGRHELVYYLRAETPGTCHVLPGVAYPMYNDRLRGETGSLKLDIE